MNYWSNNFKNPKMFRQIFVIERYLFIEIKKKIEKMEIYQYSRNLKNLTN